MNQSHGRFIGAARFGLLLVVAISGGVAGLPGRANALDLEFEPETIKKSKPPSKTLEKAIKLYEGQDFYSSTIELHEVIEGRTSDDEGNRQRAEFWMGKTLYHLGFYSAALSYFDRVVQTGATHRYYAATLKWLAMLSHILPESAGILERIGRYGRSQLEQPALDEVRGELYYLLGRHHYNQGELDDAIALFNLVDPTNPFFARAKFMEGIAHVRQYQAKPAAEAFRQILRVAKTAPDTPEIEEFEQLANLSLARVFYSTGDFERSVKYYSRINRETGNWLPSLFELSWADYQMNNFPRTLGNIHTLNSPFFEDYFFPESLIVKAVVYWKHCQYDRSQAALQEFNSRYPALKEQLEAVLKQHEDPTEFYEVARQLRENNSMLPASVARLAGVALSDRMLSKSFEYVTEIDRELQQVQQADPAWQQTPIATTVLQDLALQQSLSQREAGDLSQRRLKRLVSEIKELEKQAIRIEYENINGKKNALEASLREERVVTSGEGRRFEADDEHEYWPFDGEYWRDELGSYRVRVNSQCAQ